MAGLARALGRAPSSLYFHIAKLENLGLVVRRGIGSPTSAPSVRYPEHASVLYDVPKRWIAVHYEPNDRRTKKPIEILTRSMTAIATRNFGRAYRPGVIVNGPERQLWASRFKRGLTPRELQHVNKHLAALQRIFNQRDAGRGTHFQLMELSFVLAPAPVKPFRRRRRPG